MSCPSSIRVEVSTIPQGRESLLLKHLAYIAPLTVRKVVPLTVAEVEVDAPFLDSQMLGTSQHILRISGTCYSSLFVWPNASYLLHCGISLLSFYGGPNSTIMFMSVLCCKYSYYVFLAPVLDGIKKRHLWNGALDVMNADNPWSNCSSSAVISFVISFIFHLNLHAPWRRCNQNLIQFQTSNLIKIQTFMRYKIYEK